MSDERAEGAMPQTEAAPVAWRRGRLRVALIALTVIAVVGVAAFLSAEGPESPAPTGGPSVTLDAALAAGEPVYILIHSLT
ncbi:MAG: hypothetical protein JXA36_00540 [Coriobacteriia bacterium]|nr:hypothetical protein [Coriobacteriia bacterium]